MLGLARRWKHGHQGQQHDPAKTNNQKVAESGRAEDAHESSYLAGKLYAKIC